MYRKFNSKQIVIWISALVIGMLLGGMGMAWIKAMADFIATVYTRLFHFLAVPTIALAVASTLASLGSREETGRIFRRTLVYTLLTTLTAAVVGLLLFIVVQPESLPVGMVAEGGGNVPDDLKDVSYYDHFLKVVPSNIIAPFLEGNVLSVLLLSAAVGIALAKMPDSAGKRTVMDGISGLQEVLFVLIRALIWALPLGIVAYAAQLSAELSAGMMAESIGRYVAVIVGGNVLQFVLVLPLFLLSRGLNPLRTFRCMSPAVLMAFFTKSSAATLPVTMQCAEERMGADGRVSRFVLPICTTINMNGCAAFILVTSLFVMQNGGIALTPLTMAVWVLIAVVSAIGNAGVPMGCYFLTLSLMSGMNMPVGIMGIILPVYTVIDMMETAENVWSDSCVCAMVDKDLTIRS